MTVIVYRKGVLLADSAASYGDMYSKAMKIHEVPGGYAAGAGSLSNVMEMVEWYRAGANPGSFPAFQRDSDTAVEFLVVTRKTRRSRPKALLFERTPFPIDVSNRPFVTLGNGREIAAGALLAGASSRKACEIAAKNCPHCGLPVVAKYI